jgi:hypothetical protein
MLMNTQKSLLHPKSTGNCQEFVTPATFDRLVRDSATKTGYAASQNMLDNLNNRLYTTSNIEDTILKRESDARIRLLK